MFCHKCGKELANDGLFCQYCGTPAIAPPKAEPVPEVTPDPPVIIPQKNAPVQSPIPEPSATHAAASAPDAPMSPSANSKPTKNNRYCQYCGKLLDSEKKRCASCGKTQRKKIPLLLVLIPALILVALAGLNVYQYIQYNAALTEKNDSIDKLTADNLSLTKEISDLTNEIDELTDDISDMDQELDDMNKTVQSHVTAKAIYQNLSSFFSSNKASSYNKYKSFFADTNVVVVREGESATLSVTYKGNNTIWMDAEKDYYIDYEWLHGWSNDTTKAQVTGKNAGSTLLTFGIEDSSDRFYVMVIVVK